VTTTPTLPSGPTITQNPDGSTTQIFDDGSTLTTSPTGQVTSTPATDTVTTGPTVPSGPTITQNPDGSSTQVFDDGSTLTTKPDGTVTSTTSTDTGTGTGTGTTQVFDDGSTLTTKPDGTVTSTPATDTVTPGVPVVDAVPTSQGTNNTLGNSNPSVLDAGGRWTAALLESVGLAGLTSNQILALMAAGALAPSVLQALGLIETPAAKTTSYGPLDYTPLPAFDKTALAQPGLNPGLIPVRPYYQTTNEMQPQYYWGKAPYIGTAEDVSKLQNIPGAPATPFGYNVKPSSFDVDKFIRETITPQQSQALAGAGGNYQIVGGQPVQQAAPVTPEVIGNKVVAQTPVADKFADFYASPEYQTYQTQLGENPIGTMDIYESPYFGFQGSGSIGRAQDRAYEQYLSRVNPAAISSPVNPVIPDALPNAASAVAPVAPQQVIVG
jgi:uncharacterized protein (DUF1330 family)